MMPSDDCQDFVEVVQAFLVFDFGDDLDVFAAVGLQVLTDFQRRLERSYG